MPIAWEIPLLTIIIFVFLELCWRGWRAARWLIRSNNSGDAKRQKLAKLRVQVNELEAEILEEEQLNAPGPMRRAARVPTED